MIKVTLKTDKRQYISKGESIFEAISNLPVDYTNTKTKGTITVSKGKKKAEKFFFAHQLRMQICHPLRRKGLAIVLEKLLNA